MTGETGKSPDVAKRAVQSFWRSKGARLLLVFLLTVLMAIPLMMLGGITSERQSYSQEAAREIGSVWGGSQSLIGPLLLIPTEGEVVQRAEDGKETILRQSRVIVVAPETLNVDVRAETETRYRGIFDTTVYSATAKFEGRFGKIDLKDLVREGETPLWDKAVLKANVSDPRGFRNNVAMQWDGREIDFEPSLGGIALAPNLVNQRRAVRAPVGRSGGLQARIGDPREVDGGFSFTLDLRGSGQLFVAPVGRDTAVKMQADWPHPSFDGAFLPVERDISETGFTAEWRVPYLARGFPQSWVVANEAASSGSASGASFGVLFYQPVNFYQKVQRALKYALLFIGLTFVTIFLLEGVTRSKVHSVQYLLVGLAECVFFLLLLAFAEHIGFAKSYLLAAVATIALLTVYAATALQAGRATWIVTASLVTLYAFLYLLLESRDYALLIGSIAAFICLAVTMMATRRVNWWLDDD